VTVNLGLYFQLNNLTYAGKRSHEKQLIERPPSAVFSPFEVLIQGCHALGPFELPPKTQIKSASCRDERFTLRHNRGD
ncbi:hypothetical protein AB4501_24045, partial [Vibrio sp. 10N.222.55.E8]